MPSQRDQFWTYQVEAAPGVPPPDSIMTQVEWLKLTPGYRREIWRDWQRRGAPVE